MIDVDLSLTRDDGSVALWGTRLARAKPRTLHDYCLRSDPQYRRNGHVEVSAVLLYMSEGMSSPRDTHIHEATPLVSDLEL